MYDFLNGARVLDLTSVVLGPFATRYLGDFGADVIKVEPPAGDIFRYVRPSRSADMGAGFLNVNRNKRSVVLDLKDKHDRERFDELISEADVLVHNMRHSAAERLGLDPDVLRQRYPRLIYCAAPGYSSHGRYADRPAYDDVIQSACGLAALNQTSDNEPRFVPSVLCDKVCGMQLAMAILAAITRQTRTGQGCYVEAPMFEGMVSFLMAEHLAGETFRPALGEMGYERLLSEYRRPHRTSDGYITVLPYTADHWVRVLDFLEHEFAHEDWLLSSSQRNARVHELYGVLSSRMPDRTTQEWFDIFEDLDIPCSPVNTMESLLSDKHLEDVQLFSDVQHPTEGAIRTIRTPFWVDGVAEHADAPAPSRPAPQRPAPQSEDPTQTVRWRASVDDTSIK